SGRAIAPPCDRVALLAHGACASGEETMNIRALPLYVTIAIFIVAYAICWMQFPAMLSTRVIANLLTANAYLGIVAVGMTLVIISGWIDLSVGSVFAFWGVCFEIVSVL